VRDKVLPRGAHAVDGGEAARDLPGPRLLLPHGDPRRGVGRGRKVRPQQAPATPPSLLPCPTIRIAPFLHLASEVLTVKGLLAES